MTRRVFLLLCIAVSLSVVACRDDLSVHTADASSEPQDTHHRSATLSDSSATPGSLHRAAALEATQAPYLRAVDTGPLPAGLPDLRAATCGKCHQQIYEEWRISTHARAWGDDAQFQVEFHKPRENGSDVSWLCRNCHTPVRRQQPKLVTGLKDGALDQPIYEPNPHFDPQLQQDAVTCASCHVRDGVVLGPFGDTAAPHPVAKSDDLLSNKVCTDCHQANAWFEKIGLACVFDTGSEFDSGPYAKDGFTCQRCHMPEVQRPLIAGGPVRNTRRHWFGGSMIPKQERFEDEIAALREHFPDGMTLAWIELPNRLLSMSAITLQFSVYNERAGHSVPTGDPERFVLVTARIKDAAGATIAARTERIGSVWEWSPQPRKISDNRLGPRERRSFELQFTSPSAGPLTLELEASKWRISEANLDYHDLRGKTVPGRVFYTSNTSIEVH